MNNIDNKEINLFETLIQYAIERDDFERIYIYQLLRNYIMKRNMKQIVLKVGTIMMNGIYCINLLVL